MKYTVNQAAQIVGVTRQTIYRHIDSKPISVSKDDEGNQLIEASELIRVYGNDINFSALSDTAKSQETVVTRNKLQDVTPDPVTSNVEDAVKVAKLEAQLDSLKQLLDNKEDETDYIKKLLEEEKSERKAANNLLEDHRDKESQWQKQFSAMESRISNIEKNSKTWEERARKQLKEKKELQKNLEAQKAKLEEEYKKPIWKKFFG